MKNYILISKFLHNFHLNYLNENENENENNLNLNKNIIKTAKRIEYLEFIHCKKILKESYKLFLNPINEKNLKLCYAIKNQNNSLYKFLFAISKKNYSLYEFNLQLKNLTLNNSKKEFIICETKFPIYKNNFLIEQTKKIENLFEIFDILKKGWDIIVGGFKKVYSFIKLIFSSIINFRKIKSPNDKSLIKRATNDTIKQIKELEKEEKLNPSSPTEKKIINKIINFSTNPKNIKTLAKNPGSSPINLLQTIAIKTKIDFNKLKSSENNKNTINELFGFNLPNNKENISPEEKYKNLVNSEELDFKNNFNVYLNERNKYLNLFMDQLKSYENYKLYPERITNELKSMFSTNDSIRLIFLLKLFLSKYLVTFDETLMKRKKTISNEIITIFKSFASQHKYAYAFLMDLIDKILNGDLTNKISSKLELFGNKELADNIKIFMSRPEVVVGKLGLGYTKKEFLDPVYQQVKDESTLAERIGIFFSEHALDIAIYGTIILIIGFVAYKIWKWKGDIFKKYFYRLV